mgnify:CR=1 FL=1
MKKEEKKETKKVEVKKTENKKREKYIAEKKPVKKEKKNKGNIFKSIGKYFKGVGKEIKRIKWTSGKDLVKYSIAAVAFVLFFGIYFYGIDWIALLVRSLAK